MHFLTVFILIFGSLSPFSASTRGQAIEYKMSIQRKTPFVLCGGLALAGLGTPNFWPVSVDAVQISPAEVREPLLVPHDRDCRLLPLKFKLRLKPLLTCNGRKYYSTWSYIRRGKLGTRGTQGFIS